MNWFQKNDKLLELGKSYLFEGIIVLEVTAIFPASGIESTCINKK